MQGVPTKSALARARTSIRRIIAAASLGTTSDGVPSESEVRAATVTTKNIPILGRASHRTSNLDELDAADLDPICGCSRRATVKIVLLDINTVLTNVGKSNVLERDVVNLGSKDQFLLGLFVSYLFTNRASCARVGLNAASILTINDMRIQELDAIDNIITLAANRPNTKTMTTRAVHVGNFNVCT